jgi:hypothetical protein
MLQVGLVDMISNSEKSRFTSHTTRWDNIVCKEFSIRIINTNLVYHPRPRLVSKTFRPLSLKKTSVDMYIETHDYAPPQTAIIVVGTP